MAAPIDFPPYLSAPKLSAASAVVLVRRLINAAPEDLTEREREALVELRGSAVGIQDIERRRQRARPENLQPQDRRFDGYWGLLHDQLHGWLRVEGEPEYEEASSLVALLFPDGLRFVTVSYEEEWFESGKRLALIDEQDLTERLEALVKETILPKIRDAHAALGEGLGVGETYEEPADGAALRKQLKELAQNLIAYARIMAGAVDDDDEASAARFLSAMGPIDRHRARYGPNPNPPVTPAPPVTDPTEDDTDDPNAPIPPVA